jgi:ribonucleoside-diphosphate reductase beta chain
VLDQLALNDLFSEALKTPCMKSRISYMNKSLASKDGDNQDYVKALIFFSLFVENVSLFSQFLTISVFNKELNQVNGLAQGISATQLEEDLHATVGANIIQDLRKEKPLWFTPELEAEVHEMISEAYKAELSIIDWIFEEGELDFLPKKVVIEYIKMRTNKGLTMAGFAPYFELDEALLQQIEWFDIQTKTTIHRDFFSGHSTNYTKNTTSFTEDDLF